MLFEGERSLCINGSTTNTDAHLTVLAIKSYDTRITYFPQWQNYDNEFIKFNNGFMENQWTYQNEQMQRNNIWHIQTNCNIPQ